MNMFSVIYCDKLFCYFNFSLKLTEFNRPDSYVVVNPGSGISWQLLRARISLTGALHYEYKWGL